ncbi:uncharacterized protein SCDLUD_000487 [Saccharomycodes ludwigii]|uniref:uncharacterized protein n=1 Tax=Saccharomycodes ludwigii TaxID=36035 RepID=UPI001E87E6FE|nr:hypothetical protein SCDLUD_000487 [Saccharomycodes ludwigii]KAH3902892.1 hypothetical protein SCDLUD_000487 [Saccharomycodes ludwigii]
MTNNVISNSSQTLQNLLFSEEFNKPPSTSSTNHNDIGDEAILTDVETYNKCQRLYITGDFIQVLEEFDKHNKLDANIATTNNKTNKKWDELLYITLNSMETLHFDDEHTNLYDKIGKYLQNHKVNEVYNNNKNNNDNDGTKAITVSDLNLDLNLKYFQSYFKYIKDKGNSTRNGSTNFKEMRAFSLVISDFIETKLLQIGAIFNSDTDNENNNNRNDILEKLYMLIEFFIFEVEINGLHKVRSLKLYDNVMKKHYSIFSNTKYENIIKKKLGKFEKNGSNITSKNKGTDSLHHGSSSIREHKLNKNSGEQTKYDGNDLSLTKFCSSKISKILKFTGVNGNNNILTRLCSHFLQDKGADGNDITFLGVFKKNKMLIISITILIVMMRKRISKGKLRLGFNTTRALNLFKKTIYKLVSII